MAEKFMRDRSQNNSHQAIEVRQLKKVFRKRKRQGLFKYTVSEQWAVKDVSFEVAQGETYGLLGPNGSGKSTLIRILSTLLIPDHGEVRLMGHRLPDEESAVRWKIGRVSVDAAFYKKLSARENLLYSRLSLRARTEVRREARVRNPRTPRNRVEAVFRPARRDEPWDAAEGLDRARVDDQPADAAARRADDGTRPEEPPRRSTIPRRASRGGGHDDPADHARHERGGAVCARALAFSRTASSSPKARLRN